MVNLLPLCQKKPPGVSCSVAAKVGNCDLENTVRFLLLEMFSKSPPFSGFKGRGEGQSEGQASQKASGVNRTGTS